MTTQPPELSGDAPRRRSAPEQYPDLVVQLQRRLLALPPSGQVTLLLILARELASEELIRSGPSSREEAEARAQTEQAKRQREVFAGYQQRLNRLILRIHHLGDSVARDEIESFYRVATWFACEGDFLHALERVRRNPLSEREQCPCCGYFTLDERGEYDICKVCFWEDESPYLIYGEPVEGGWTGANNVPLEQARENFLAFGAGEERFIKNVRPPLPTELPEQQEW